MTVVFNKDEDPGIRISVYDNPIDGVYIDYEPGKLPIPIPYHEVDQVLFDLGISDEAKEYVDRGWRVSFKTLSTEYLDELIAIQETNLDIYYR